VCPPLSAVRAQVLNSHEKLVILATVQSSAAYGPCPALLALNPPNESDPTGACRRKFNWTAVGPTAALDLYSVAVSPAALFGTSCASSPRQSMANHDGQSRWPITMMTNHDGQSRWPITMMANHDGPSR
jgi:hypothetical protein